MVVVAAGHVASFLIAVKGGNGHMLISLLSLSTATASCQRHHGAIGVGKSVRVQVGMSMLPLVK